MGIRDSGLTIRQIVSPTIARSELALVHEPAYIEMIKAFCELGGGALDMDTFVSRESWGAALRAAGGVRALIEELESRPDATGFALARPPGHHALPDRAMGFCVFNNVAVAAAYLRSRGDRVAILDWDVHHGNGTQDMFADDPGVLYASIHQAHFYPFAGEVEDIEVGAAKGTVVNIPLPSGTAGDVYRMAWSELILPVVSQFEPTWVLVSAGFDGHTNDQLADFHLTSGDYGSMASGLARVHPTERTIFALEGGYDLGALHDSARATVLGASGEPGQPGTDLVSPPGAAAAYAEAAAAVARHWAV